MKVFQACLNIEDKQKVNVNLQDDCTEYVKDKYQRKSSSIYQKSFLERNLLRVLYKSMLMMMNMLMIDMVMVVVAVAVVVVMMIVIVLIEFESGCLATYG